MWQNSLFSLGVSVKLVYTDNAYPLNAIYRHTHTYTHTDMDGDLFGGVRVTFVIVALLNNSL